MNLIVQQEMNSKGGLVESEGPVVFMIFFVCLLVFLILLAGIQRINHHIIADATVTPSKQKRLTKLTRDISCKLAAAALHFQPDGFATAKLCVVNKLPAELVVATILPVMVCTIPPGNEVVKVVPSEKQPMQAVLVGKTFVMGDVMENKTPKVLVVTKTTYVAVIGTRVTVLPKKTTGLVAWTTAVVVKDVQPTQAGRVTPPVTVVPPVTVTVTPPETEVGGSAMVRVVVNAVENDVE